jgi:ATP-dependent helicase/nuclease subunit A
LIDRDDRRAAVLTQDHAFVWASAGTGKTHTLTLRALYLLLRAATGLRTADRTQRRRAAREALLSIVLTTFTRKAAAEMRTRLYGYLDAVVGSSDLESLRRSELARRDPLFVELVEEALRAWPAGSSFEDLRSAAEVLAERAAELQVSTIHSLAVGILRRNSLEAGLPAECRFAREDEDDPSDFEERLLERWWRTEAAEDKTIGALLDEVLRVVPLSDLWTWSRAILSHSWIADRLEALDPGLEARESAREALEDLAGILGELNGSKLRETGRRLAGALGRDDWVEIASLLEEHRAYLFLKPGVGLKEALNRHVDSRRTLLADPGSLYATTVGRALGSTPLRGAWSAWCALARLQSRWYRDAGIRELGMVTFDEMIRRTALLLESVPSVRRTERSRLRAVLVDEFQDTDPWQLRLLGSLLGRFDESDHEVLGFFVGDLKQSIYRFRGADVASIREFHRNYSSLVGTGRPARDFRLQTSFRTREPISRFINYFFEGPLPLAEKREWLHVPSTAAADGPLPRWIQLREGPEPMRAARARETAARAVGRLVRDASARGIRRSDILVLTRDNRDLDVLLSTLQGEGVPVIASGARTFYRHPEVLDTLNLLVCLHNPLDHLAVAAVLRSPLVGATDRQLECVLSDPGAEAVLFGDRPLPTDLPELPLRRIKTLRELAAARRTEGLSDWLARVERFVPRSAYLDPGDPEGRSVVRIRKVIRNFGEECRLAVTPPLVWLLRQRARSARVDRWDASLGEDVALADETVDAVRAMTVHKAKGLESEVVIVYDWNDILREAPAFGPGTAESVLAPIGDDGSEIREFSLRWGPVTVRTSGFEKACLVERIQTLEEGRRLAYVAATRAKREIVFLLPEIKPWPGIERVEAFQRGTSADLVEWAVWRDLPETLVGTAIPDPGFDRTAGRLIWERREEAFRESSRLLNHPTGEGEDSGAQDDLPLLRSPGVERALAVGRLAHTYLERWIHLPRFHRELLDSLATEGVNEALLGAVESVLRAFFEGRCRDESGSPYRDRLLGARILARELPVFLQHEGKSWHGVMDLVLREAGGRVVGVDYKTGRRLDPLPESLRLQQAVYSEAVGRMGGPDAIFEFWWLSEAPDIFTPVQKSFPFP